MAIQFIIDSASDVLPSEAAELGVTHLPLKVLFGENEYADAVDLTHNEFYEKLVASEALPTTSQVSPAEFEEAYRKITDAGDTAVVITISSKLSGTYQSAIIAAEDYEDKVFVVDSLSATAGERLLLELGMQLRDKGMSAAEIAAELDVEKHNIRLYAILDTLEYLKKGGRISAAVAFAGNILSIKPIIAVENGEVVLATQARGMKKAYSTLSKLITNCSGFRYDKPYSFLFTGTTDQLLQKYLEDSADLWEGHMEKFPIHSVGCAIGTHVGPGAVAIVFFEK